MDTFDTTAAVPLRLLWHLGPDIAVDLDGTRGPFLASRVGLGGGALVLPEGLTWTRHRAENDPISVGIPPTSAVAFLRLL